VWRELRRLEASADLAPVIEAARSAADCGRSGHDETGAAGNWRRYVEVMGGPVMRRDDRPIGIARTRPGERYSYAAGALELANLTRYGEVAPGAVYGLIDRASARAFASVRYRWEIKGGRDVRCSEDGAGAIVGALVGDGAPEGALSELVGKFAAAPDSSAGVASVFPWSPVNNCSRELPPGLPWVELIAKTPVKDREFWLDGAALSAWVAEKGVGYG
jgi:hypothetical protein